MADIPRDSFEDSDYQSYSEEEYIEYLSEEDADNADIEAFEIVENTVTDQQDERYYDTYTDTISDYPTTISREEVGDVHDPRFIYTGSTYGDEYRDTIQDSTPPFEGSVPTEQLVSRTRRGRRIQQTVDAEDVTDMADPTVDNDTRVILDVPIPLPNDKIRYRKRYTPNTNRRGNKAKDAPYQSKINASIDIDPIEEVRTNATVITTNTGPLASLNPELLLSRDPRKWYKLPYLKTVLNSTGLVNIPPETSDRNYVTHLAVSLINQYNVQFNREKQ